MNFVNELDDEILEDEDIDMGSLYHGMTQANITGLLIKEERFVVITELSLDASKIDLTQFGLKTKDEFKPDICVYKVPSEMKQINPKRADRDIIKVSTMPDLAIEILSPNQSVNMLLRKFDALFALGVKSCWLVMPVLEEIRIFSQPHAYKIFDLQRDTEVIDEVMGIRQSIQEIFKRRFFAV
ncbi:MAG: Uma2 family endonuclease [Leptospiraceae bacterium]|nr:Uma2 family endonuclease [Leptospiraceae bacterium]